MASQSGGVAGAVMPYGHARILIPLSGSRDRGVEYSPAMWAQPSVTSRQVQSLEIVPVNVESERLDEGDLLRRLRAGEQASFDAIFRAHYSHLVGFAQGLLRDRSAAEDAAQEVMLELWRRRAEVAIT